MRTGLRLCGRAVALGAIAILAVGCAPRVESAPPAESGALTASAEASVSAPPSLPLGFPVFPGASPALLAHDDPDQIAAWTMDQHGSAAYDFFVDALPAAGYPIEGLYPGGQFAIIRFHLGRALIWQVVIGGPPGEPVRIEVRLDRP